MKTIVDCHSHTSYSGHGEGTVAQAVARAQKLGLAVYAQTEHLTLPQDLDPKREDSLSPEDALKYVFELELERERLSREGCPMDLVIGIEADWLAGRAQELELLCAPYEYVIGSIHFLEGLALDNSDDMRLWETYGIDGVWERYLEQWESMIRSSAPIDCLGHPDLPKVFGNLPSFSLRDAYGDLAQLAASKGLMIEVNTAGWRKPCGEQYPSQEVLDLFCQAGIACTVGADAHRPSDIACDVERAYRLMYEAGYRQVTVPTSSGDRRPFDLQ